jgi:hypothetical protein
LHGGLKMIDLKDEEDTENSMSLDMRKFLHFCCKVGLTLDCYDKANIIVRLDKKELLNLDFSDFYYPKNLLRTVKERINEVS